MVSHRKAAEDLYAKLFGETAGAGDITTAAKLAKRYAKQLCKVLRDEQLAQSPQLSTAAAVGVRANLDEDRDLGDDPYAGADDEQVPRAFSAPSGASTWLQRSA